MANQQNGLLLGPVAVNGFPARRLTKSNSYQGGEWVTAYQAEQRTRLRAVFLSQEQQERQGRHGRSTSWVPLSPPANTREASGVGRRVLDREFLMRHCFVETPSDLSHADISDVHQKSYKAEDFTEFDSLVHMNASDSALPMEAFKMFPVLERLELCMCGISDISLIHSDFARLQCLDLSYNAVSGRAILALGTLPRLRELHLTGNDIVALPVEMSRPFRTNKEPSETGSPLDMRFAALETLWLDDNKLTDQTTFSTLAGLRRLRFLNLDNNELYTVPQLRLIGTSRLRSDDRGSPPHIRTSLTPRGDERLKVSRGQRSSSGRHQSGETSDQQENGTTEVRPTQPVTEKTEEMPATEERGSDGGDGGEGRECSDAELAGELGGKETRGEGRHTAGLTETERPVSLGQLPPSMAPFPHLHTLSLANNLFFSPEGLLACGLWPVLKELIIHGNPLISMRNGMPPRLQIELVQKKDIHIVRHKPKAKAFRIGQRAKEFKKIPAEVVNQTQLSLPAPPTNPLPLPPPTSSPLSLPPLIPHTHTTSDRQEDCEEGVFITQGKSEQDNVLKQLSGGTGQEERKEQMIMKRDVSEWKRRLKEKYATADIPKHYRGYEALLEEDSLPVPPIPADLYGCIHALRHALKHGSTYKPTAALRHTHRHHHRSVEGVSGLSRETATHRKVRDMHVSLDEIRTSTATLQANLADLLQMDNSNDRTTVKLQKEGKHLLKQLQAKYANAQRENTSFENHTK